MNDLVPSQQRPASGDDRWTYVSPVRPAAPNHEGVPIDLGRLLVTLRRRWWLIAMITVAAGGGAWYQVRDLPPVYHASAIIQLLDPRNTVAGGLVSNLGDRVPAMYMTPSQVEIIRSRAVANAVVDSEPLGLRVNASGFPNALLSDVSLDEGASPFRFPVRFTRNGVMVGGDQGELATYGRPASWGGVHFVVHRPPGQIIDGAIVVTSRDRAADGLISRLDAIPRKQTNLIDITYSAQDRNTARNVVNRVARAYQAVDTRMAQQQLHRRRVFIEEQLARTDAQLAEADRALSTFRNQQQAYSSQEKFKAQQSAMLGLDVRREELDGNRRMANALLRRFETGNAAGQKSALSMLASSPEVSGDQSPVPDLYKTLLSYQRSRAELVSGPSGKANTHPEVQRLDTLIASTQADLLSAAKAHIALLNARIEALDDVRSKNAGALEQLPAAEAAESRLQQNSDVFRNQAATLRLEYQQARIAEAAEVGQVEIVDLATHASRSPSGRGRFVAFALFLGLLLGAGIALLIERADRTFRGRDDIELSLQIPVLGTIPRIGSNGSHRDRIPFITDRSSRRMAGINKQRKVALTAIVQSRSPGAEAFRHLGTNLFYSRAGQSARRILVTSPTEGDGKTSIASNLAITLAHQRHRVLLIDCDIYGKLHTIFQLPASPGISDVVIDGAHPSDVIHATGIPGLSLLTSGRRSEHATDVIGSDRMRAMLKDMTHEFDLVVLDCSPILALADSTILSVNSDAVLLVVRAGHTASAAAVEAIRQLSTVGARVAGVVLNDPDDRARQYGGYYPTYNYAGR